MNIEHPSFGRMDESRVIVFDTTLRDGEQSPGFSMNISEKVRLAEALADLGVDVIEAGFPIASTGDFDSVVAIAEAVRGPVICGLARSAPGDILRAAEAVRGAERSRIHTFISTSALHMKHKLRMEPDAVLEAVTASVTLARRHTADVEWSAEDGSRTEHEFPLPLHRGRHCRGGHHDQHPRHRRLRGTRGNFCDFHHAAHARARRRTGRLFRA